MRCYTYNNGLFAPCLYTKQTKPVSFNTPCPPPKRGLLALRFTQLSAKSPHWRRYLEDFVHLMPVLLTASRRASCPEGVFPCKHTADGRNTKCRLHFRREGLTAAFRKFPRALEIWVFRPRSLASHLSYPPSCPQWDSARKTAFPATKPYGALQKGKELKPTTLKTSDYACKKNDNRTRAEGRHRPLPELPPYRERKRHEKDVLRQGLPFGALRQLHLQCIG